MNKFEKMTQLHRQSDKLIDNHESAFLSKKDFNFVKEFLTLDISTQLQIIQHGVRAIHPQFEGKEVGKAVSQILFKIQLRPDDATSFGMGTPLSQR